MDTLLIGPLPGSQPSRPQPAKHTPDEFPKARRVDGLQLIGIAVALVEGVEGGAREGHALRCLVVRGQPLHLCI